MVKLLEKVQHFESGCDMDSDLDYNSDLFWDNDRDNLRASKNQERIPLNRPLC